MTESSVKNRPVDDELDLLGLAGTLWDGRVAILVVTFVFAASGIVYALIQTPVYQANSLIQVEAKEGGLPGMEDLSGLLGPASSATTEIELIKSRHVLGKVVDSLNLDIRVSPNHFPIIGEAVARRFDGAPGTLAPPLWGDHYAWGGERLVISRMEVPEGVEGLRLTFEARNGGWDLLDEGDNPVLSGIVGAPATEGGYALMVSELVARSGTRFEVTKLRRYRAIMTLQSAISASEKGRDSGIISLRYEHIDPEMARTILDAVGNHYVRQNVERNSAEAAQSLAFLRTKLPEVKAELEIAEKKLNEYQVTAETIDITAEGTALLEQVVELEARISELEIQRAEIEQRFRPTHPRYKAWARQMAELKERRVELDRRVGGLPETQQRLVRLRRDVEVGNEIYLQMLANIQQLDIARAGTIGNVRVVDEAAVNVAEPVKPKRTLIVFMATMLGGFAGGGLVLLRAALNRGIENADDIENLGLPVYAGIPLSAAQEELARKTRKGNHRQPDRKSRLLAIENPADLAVESLRSLRTSLHFGMMEAKNNILMISGPSPGVGKTFVAVNLAAVVAQADQRVLLIDADMRKGFFHEVLAASGDGGLSDLLAGKSDLERAIQASGIPRMSFIPRGTVPPNPSELLMSRRFTDFLNEVAPRFDLVIMDTPPILAVTDPVIVGRHAGTTLLVTRFGLNSINEVELSKRRFEQNGIEVKGVIFNAMVKKAAAYGYGGYGYYSYEYKAEEP